MKKISNPSTIGKRSELTEALFVLFADFILSEYRKPVPGSEILPTTFPLGERVKRPVFLEPTESPTPVLERLTLKPGITCLLFRKYKAISFIVN